MRLEPRDRVAVLVLNWNNASDTAECVESLLAQTGVGVDVLIIDNDSADGSGEILRARYPQLGYLQTGANLGYAGGNNRGIAWALARAAAWILVVNNDTILDPSCLARMVEAALREPRMGAVAPTIVRYDDPSRAWFAGGVRSDLRVMGEHRLDMREANAVRTGVVRCSFLTGCCLLIRAEALRDAGPFREDFFAYMEDVELSIRFEQHGWELGWIPSARMRHKVPPIGAPDSPMQIRLRDRNRRRIVRSHYGALQAAAFWCWFLPTRAIHLLRFALRGDLSRVHAVLAGLTER